MPRVLPQAFGAVRVKIARKKLEKEKRRQLVNVRGVRGLRPQSWCKLHQMAVLAQRIDGTIVMQMHQTSEKCGAETDTKGLVQIRASGEEWVMILIVQETARRCGRFDGWVEGSQVVIPSSTQPFLDAGPRAPGRSRGTRRGFATSI
jgi:hypothetical protein